ncbi:glycoside hydrolase family 15 protein [Pedobacter aquatilis]|uniref:glycoside hydrolase family 15 protein n=1 Tax=Pedobacter aquatilis TaxID=351343 RepID=UPI00293146F5|nr:glycoside hydrolase family 15 protein [Pedobacter aquatilis]
MTIEYTMIRDLAIISDRRSCALLDKAGTINWYCPERFDTQAIFSSLLDNEKGGHWSVSAKDKVFLTRQFDGRSSVLYSCFSIGGKGLTITDFMPFEEDFRGICRLFTNAPSVIENKISIRPDYGLIVEDYTIVSPVSIRLDKSGLYLHTSHPLKIDKDIIHFDITAGESGWAYLGKANRISEGNLRKLLQSTLQKWDKLEMLVDYHGPYENQVRYSLRSLQQMVYEPTGGIIAAATTSLPEVIGGERNYDYRYVWMRDAALITSSLTQIITNGELEEKFIAFVSGAMEKNCEDHISCFYAVDQTKVSPEIREIPLNGYLQSQPVQIGNSAADQFQLDAEGNILIACSIIYQKSGKVIYWDTVEKIADYICKNWERKDNGIWEEEQLQHYTSSKAFAARGLELIAPYQKDRDIADRWLKNAAMIREFISKNCLTDSGAFAVYAGSEHVDLSAALFVPFGVYDVKNNNMLATIQELEKNYCDEHLYRRHLLEFDSSKEGAFLAGSCWMAHYYAIAGDLQQCKKILDKVLIYSNDLGYFSEEADLNTGGLLGNFPQTFVHSSFICAVNGYKHALEGNTIIIKPIKQ